MIGQGRPHSAPEPKDRPFGRHWDFSTRLTSVFVCVCAILGSSQSEGAEPTNLRLRFAWGGGQARQWHATISIDDGKFSDSTPLGLEPDVPGSIDLDVKKIVVAAQSSREYDGVDVRVDAALDANLTIVLTPFDQPHEQYREEVKLSEVLDEYRTVPIDERQNFLLIRRSPGDRLRIDFQHKSLVFSPGDKFAVTIAPHHAALPASATFDCNIQLMIGRTNSQAWAKKLEVNSDADGIVPPLEPLDIEMPRQEGVYDFWVSFTQKHRFTTPFARPAPVLQRKIQVVVIDPELGDGVTEEWSEIRRIDPANPGWWERIKRTPQLKLLPGFGDGTLGNGLSRTAAHLDQRLIELQPQGWQAYPLPIDNVGLPHILEVEYPSNLRQTLGVSILEPNAAGSIVPIGLDSGVDVLPPDGGNAAEPRMLRHRVVFWPRTKSPLLLLTNQNETHNAVYGQIQVLAGPATLPAAAISTEQLNKRLLATYFDKPLFPENFLASDDLDGSSDQSRDDWATFYYGGHRLTEYLRYVGYNAAVVSVMCEGSTIYPSRLVEPTPKYDRGTFFTTGQDPVRKDVLEMMFRMFDRRGLKLIPALRFSSPLPELEQIKRRGGDDVVGIELVNDRGLTWLNQQRTHQGLAPYYNPLDRRVQKAMVNVVTELTERYGHHASFGGVTLQLGPYTFAQLPGESWGLDDRTIEQFQNEAEVRIPHYRDSNPYRVRGHFLRDPKGGRDEWLAWRSKKLKELYTQMLAAVKKKQPEAKLYLAAADSLTSLSMQTALRPTLPPRGLPEESLLAIGIDPELFKSEVDIVLPRPQRVSLTTSFSEKAVNVHLERSHQFDRLFTGGKHDSTFYYHVSRPMSLPSFERVSPYGSDRTQIWLVPHISSSGDENRRRLIHSVATSDTQTFIEGGWMTLLGQEDSLRDIVDVYRRLPDKPFKNVGPYDKATPRQGIVVRTLAEDDKTYCYVVNNSPWPTTVDVEFASPDGIRLSSLGTRKVAPLERRGSHTFWSVQLQPFDMVGATFSSPAVEVVDWQPTIPGGVLDQLRRKMTEVELRFSELSNQMPLDVLQNPGFEKEDDQRQMTGWLHARGPAIAIAPDAEQQSGGRGERSLRMSVRQRGDVAWLRSHPFDTPKTGRVSVLVWLRVDDADVQPPLRLAIEGRFNGEVYYKYAAVGLGSPRPLTPKWARYIFHVDDLPQSGLTDLRVGFDLMGPGTVYIDDVEVYDRWFDRNERDELLKIIAPAKLQLTQGNAAQCQRFLESYWARFLMENIDIAPRVAMEPKHVAPPMNEGAAPTDADQKRNSILDRLWPKKIRPF